jgi:hypothetical protein
MAGSIDHPFEGFSEYLIIVPTLQKLPEKFLNLYIWPITL